MYARRRLFDPPVQPEPFFDVVDMQIVPISAGGEHYFVPIGGVSHLTANSTFLQGYRAYKGVGLVRVRVPGGTMNLPT